METSAIMDMAAALAVTALLAEGYGVVRRRFVRSALAPVVLGVLFGFMAIAQMYNPLEPHDGLIIDLRNIPIALAGAFLGWRGLIPCLLIAVATRIDLGGIGTVAGIWGMVIAGLAGMIWARKMAHLDRRNLGALMLLALAMSAHLLGALALPREMAIWFFTTASGPILLMNIVAVPFIGFLLERENQRIARTDRMDAAATRDPDSGLLTPAAFVREVSSAYAARAFGTFSGFVRITPFSGPVQGLFAAFRTNVPFVETCFLAQHLEHGDLACRAVDGSVLVPLSDVEIANSNRVTHDLRQALRNGATRSGTRTPFMLDIIAAPDPASFLRTTETVVAQQNPHWTDPSVACGMSPLRPGERSHVRRSRIFDVNQHEALFMKADFLINQSHG